MSSNNGSGKTPLRLVGSNDNSHHKAPSHVCDESCDRSDSDLFDPDHSDVIAAAINTDPSSEPNTESVQVNIQIGITAKIPIGTFNPHWKHFDDALQHQRDLFIEQLLTDDCTAASAPVIADCVREAEIDRIVEMLPTFLGEMVELLLMDAHWNAVNDVSTHIGMQARSDAAHTAHLTQQFQDALKRIRSAPKREGRPLWVIWNTWHEIETAIREADSDKPPALGEFALTLSRFKPKTEPTTSVKKREAQDRARNAIKKELRKLHDDGLCPETNWTKLYRTVRNEHYQPLTYTSLHHPQVDLDAGDGLH